MRMIEPIRVDTKQLKADIYQTYIDSNESVRADFIYKHYKIRRMTLDAILKTGLIVRKTTYNKLRKKLDITKYILKNESEK